MINARWFYGISRPTYKKHNIWKGNLYLTEKRSREKRYKRNVVWGRPGGAGCNTFFLIYHITFKGNSTKVNFIWKGHLSAWFSSGSEVPHTCNFRAVNVLKQGVQVLQNAPYHGVSSTIPGDNRNTWNVPEYTLGTITGSAAVSCNTFAWLII